MYTEQEISNGFKRLFNQNDDGALMLLRAIEESKRLDFNYLQPISVNITKSNVYMVGGNSKRQLFLEMDISLIMRNTLNWKTYRCFDFSQVSMDITNGDIKIRTINSEIKQMGEDMCLIPLSATFNMENGFASVSIKAISNGNCDGCLITGIIDNKTRVNEDLVKCSILDGSIVIRSK